MEYKFQKLNPSLLTRLPKNLSYMQNGDSKNNHWLFDLGADSASRPIGVTGSRGN